MGYLPHQSRANWCYQDTLFCKQIMQLKELFYRLVIVPLVAFFPAPLAYGLACLRGNWRYRYDTPMREQILYSLEGVLGDQLSPVDRARMTRDFFRRRSCEVIDAMRLAGKARALGRLVEIHGLEHLEDALAAGKGAILCSLHFGSFNAGYSLIGACGFPVTAVGDWKSSDPSISRISRMIWWFIHVKRVTRHRHRPNIEPEREPLATAIQMVEILRSNEVIAIPIDAPTSAGERSRAVPVDFLGRQILLLPGSMSIAQLTGSPVLVLIARRSADWRHQILEISPPVPLDGGPLAAFKRCMAMLEVPIRQNPAYWDWWENPQALVDLGLLPS